MPIFQRIVLNYFVIGLITITLDPYYFMLSKHQDQDNIYQLRVLVQYGGTVPITVSFLIGGYGILEIIFFRKICSLYYYQ